MKFCLKPLSIGLAFLAANGALYAASPDQQAQIANELAAVNKQMAALQQQVKTLQNQVVTLKRKAQQNQTSHTQYASNTRAHSSSGIKGSTVKPVANSQPTTASGDHTMPQAYLDLQSRVSIAPYTGIPTYFDGSELIVNAPTINEDAKLLRRRSNHILALQQAGYPIPPNPRLVFSGGMQGIAQYTKPYTGGYNSDIDLTQAELDSFGQISHWVQMFMAMTYDNAPNNNTSANRVDNSRFYLDRGFITIGNFLKSPVYGSIGQMYVPFGRYSSPMISSPLTEFIGKTRARAISLGYRPDGTTPYAEAFVFHGAANDNGRINNVGADTGYKFKFNKFNGDLGVSGIGDIADALGMQGTSSTSGFTGFNSSSTNEHLEHPVPGADIHTVLGYGSFTLITEFVTATHAFSRENMTFNARGAKPSALDSELTYSFNMLSKPSSFTLDYGMTKQALALNLPRERLGASFAMAFLRHTIGTLEYRHDINYSTGTVATGQNEASSASSATQLGKNDNVVTAQLGVYF